MFFVVVLAGLVLVGLPVGSAAPVQNPADLELTAHNYLTRFGYLLPTNSEVNDMIHPEAAHDAFVEALKRFQRFVNVEVTGMVDAATVEMMSTPRCGVPDNQGPAPEFLLGPKWPRKHLTYRLGQSTTQLTREEVEAEIAEGFQVWADNADLTFEQTEGPADIEILFAAGEHSDGRAGAFDGPSGTLAHAYFPGAAIRGLPNVGGDAHFDDDETWTLGLKTQGIDLLQVAAHEFGHSLGLDHATMASGALMAPFYNRNMHVVALQADDIAGIQAHYGPRKTVFE